MSGDVAVNYGIWTPTHPDAAWLDQIQTAVEAWRAAPKREPTSSLTGGGVIRAFEEEFSGLVSNRPTLLVPSATYGIRLALNVLGIGPGDEVIVPSVDWTASIQAVRSLGATPVPTRVNKETLTIDPQAAYEARTQRTTAVIACHYKGQTADVVGLRGLCGSLPLIEDCAAARGTLTGRGSVGTIGDLAVFSFGPGKELDLGEGGALVSANHDLHRRALELSAHPARLALAGITVPEQHPGLMMRGNPMTALLGWYALHEESTSMSVPNNYAYLREHKGSEADVDC